MSESYFEHGHREVFMSSSHHTEGLCLDIKTADQKTTHKYKYKIAERAERAECLGSLGVFRKIFSAAGTQTTACSLF